MSFGANSAAVERHLKKIYDCLNIGCNKKAVQEVDRLPKNVRDLAVFKALKALALTRMCKRRQASEILTEINIEDNLDEVTLQTITSCYKESVDVDKIVDLYEAASRRKPDDPEIMAHLFMAYVRVFNFKRQKEIALQMYKAFPKKKRLYSFWAIISLVMQSQDSKSSASDKKVCLTLAEKMCEKMIDDGRVHEEIELYLSILRKQDKHEEEYRFLAGPVCLRITDHLSWFNRRRAYLCLDLKMYSRAFKHYFPTLIQEYPDQIEYYQGLFKSALLLDTEAPSQQQPVAIADQQSATSNQTAGTPVKSSSALAECFDIVDKQCQFAIDSTEPTKDQTRVKSTNSAKNLSRTSSLNPTQRRLLRGPFIARVELYNLVFSNQFSLPKDVIRQCKKQFCEKYPSVVSLMVEYFQSFSRKIICVYDMEYMINQCKLNDIEIDTLLGKISVWVSSLRSHQPEISDQEFDHIRLVQMMLNFAYDPYRNNDSQTNRLKIASEFITDYNSKRYLCEGSCETDILPIDHYCLLAVSAMTTNATSLDDLTSQSKLSDSILVSLIVMLETSIQNSPNNHQLKLILLKLYSLVGASRQCSETLVSLNIKHFQIDTLGHLLNPVLYDTGNYSLARESLETCSEFYAHGTRECFEGLTTSYRDGRFSKIEEVGGVLHRLSNSLNKIQCLLLRIIVANLNATTFDDLSAAILSFDPNKSLERIFRSSDSSTDIIRDSRDFRVLKSLHYETDQLIRRRQQQTLRDEQIWLKLRYYLVRSAFIQVDRLLEKAKKVDKSGDTSTNFYDELNLGRAEVCKLVEQIKQVLKDDGADKAYSYLEPESSPFRWKHINFELLLAMIEPIVFCCDTQSLDSQDLENYTHRLDSIVSQLEDQASTINSFVTMKQFLLSSTITVEFISLSVTSLVAISQLDSASTNNVPQSGTPSKSANSQQQQSSLQQPPVSKSKSVANQLINKTEAQLTKISNIIKSVDPKSLVLDKIGKLDEVLSADGKQRGQVEIKKPDGSMKLHALFGHESGPSSLLKVKEKILDSYSDSLKEIESTCRRKIKLLRVRV